MKIMGQRIKGKRTEAGLSMQQLADKIGVSKGAIAKWEKGESKPSRPYIKEMCDLFNCTPAWLMDMEVPNVEVTYSAPGKEPVTLKAAGDPIIGEVSLRAQLYEVASKVRTEDLQVAIKVLKTLVT